MDEGEEQTDNKQGRGDEILEEQFGIRRTIANVCVRVHSRVHVCACACVCVLYDQRNECDAKYSKRKSRSKISEGVP